MNGRLNRTIQSNVVFPRARGRHWSKVLEEEYDCKRAGETMDESLDAIVWTIFRTTRSRVQFSSRDALICRHFNSYISMSWNKRRTPILRSLLITVGTLIDSSRRCWPRFQFAASIWIHLTGKRNAIISEKIWSTAFASMKGDRRYERPQYRYLITDAAIKTPETKVTMVEVLQTLLEA